MRWYDGPESWDGAPDDPPRVRARDAPELRHESLPYGGVVVREEGNGMSGACLYSEVSAADVLNDVA